MQRVWRALGECNLKPEAYSKRYNYANVSYTGNPLKASFKRSSYRFRRFSSKILLREFPFRTICMSSDIIRSYKVHQSFIELNMINNLVFLNFYNHLIVLEKTWKPNTGYEYFFCKLLETLQTTRRPYRPLWCLLAFVSYTALARMATALSGRC